VTVDPTTGRLLLASPQLDDPTFHRTVVLVLDHDEDGALGVVLNRVSLVPVREAVRPGRSSRRRPAGRVRGRTGRTGRDRRARPHRGARRGRPWAASSTNTCGSSTSPPTPILERIELETVRIFAGTPGGHRASSSTRWCSTPGSSSTPRQSDVFTADPEGLWHTVLRRQAGQLRLLATFPDDPSMN
jgi:putative transcriptional regulator